MLCHTSTHPVLESIPVRKSLVVLSGYGLNMHVEHGRLVVADGLEVRPKSESPIAPRCCQLWW
jgi:hypothetical protein